MSIKKSCRLSSTCGFVRDNAYTLLYSNNTLLYDEKRVELNLPNFCYFPTELTLLPRPSKSQSLNFCLCLVEICINRSNRKLGTEPMEENLESCDGNSDDR